MQIVNILEAGSSYEYKWPDGYVEPYSARVDYQTTADDGQHRVRIAVGRREVYGRDRVRVVVFVDGYPHAEFLGADDFDASGDVLSEIKVEGERGLRMCRYPHEPLPERYSAFPVVGLVNRVLGTGVHNAWAVVANIADHRTMIGLAGLRAVERRG